MAARGRSRPPAPPFRISTDLLQPLTRLVGREHEVGQAAAFMRRSDVRLLTLTGPPGSGKTHLALALAMELRHRYRDGVVVVALGAIVTAARSTTRRTFSRAGAEVLKFRMPAAAGSSPSRLLAVAGEREHHLIIRSLPELAAGFRHGSARIGPGVGHA